MRDLNLGELEQVYGAGGCGRPNSCYDPCGGSSTKSKSKKSKTKKSKCKTSKSKKHSFKCS